jgi:crotonobetainyl-CoA:carnitine CoA-transferase CaiB-like acyl-CoA transferase
MPGPLTPYTVLDLTRARAGPTCVRQLADLGAQVIQITARTDAGAELAPHGFDYQNLHRNKRSLTLDIRQPLGLEMFRRLVGRADVLVENFRPDVKHRLGIAYEGSAASCRSPACPGRVRCGSGSRSPT